MISTNYFGLIGTLQPFFASSSLEDDEVLVSNPNLALSLKERASKEKEDKLLRIVTVYKRDKSQFSKNMERIISIMVVPLRQLLYMI